MLRTQVAPRDGLGLPIVPIIMGVSAIVGLFRKPKKPKVTKEDAKNAVEQIYLELLERDPWNPYDQGAEGYVNCLVEGWCNTDFVRTEVLKAPEYRDVQARKAAKVYGTTPPVPMSGAPGAPPPSAFGDLIPPTIGGIPTAYVAGGLVLLMLLKRK